MEIGKFEKSIQIGDRVELVECERDDCPYCKDRMNESSGVVKSLDGTGDRIIVSLGSNGRTDLFPRHLRVIE